MRIVLLCCALASVQCGSSGGASDDGAAATGADLRSAGGGDLAQSPSSSSDLASAAGADLATSGLCCGQPGDAGNELGVGKYCSGLGDCIGLSANLCATLGDPQLHFCTMICSQGGNCGAGAACQCQGGQCGCFPNACLNMPASC